MLARHGVPGSLDPLAHLAAGPSRALLHGQRRYGQRRKRAQACQTAPPTLPRHSIAAPSLVTYRYGNPDTSWLGRRFFVAAQKYRECKMSDQSDIERNLPDPVEYSRNMVRIAEQSRELVTDFLARHPMNAMAEARAPSELLCSVTRSVG